MKAKKILLLLYNKNSGKFFSGILLNTMKLIKRCRLQLKILFFFNFFCRSILVFKINLQLCSHSYGYRVLNVYLYPRSIILTGKVRDTIGIW